MDEQVGFIGLGSMGSAMCVHLIDAGYAMRVFARRRSQTEVLAMRGALVCESPQSLAQQCTVICLNVTTSEDVLEILFGPHGIAESIRAGSVVVDFSTISASAARLAALRLRSSGVSMLDCPVSGGAAGARAASLSIMVGGDRDALVRVHPLLKALGHRITHVGSSGAGQVAKACNQMVQVVAIEAIAEAMTYASAEGVDLAPVLEAMAGGYAASKMLEIMGPRMLARNFEAGIPARLHCKDIGLVAVAAEQLGLTLPVLEALSSQLNVLRTRGLEHCDSSVLLQVLEGVQAG